MKKIALVLVAAMALVLTGCGKRETISMPFDVADVNNIEMYRNAEPNSAEKQVITESEDIADLYSLFSGLEVSDKKTEPVAGGTITSFRFNLSDDTSYEIIYCAEAVKSGRLKFPAEKLDYFTSADIGGCWDDYQYEIVPVSESELPGQSESPADPPLGETHEWDKIPMVMVDGKLYYDTGKESTISGRCGVMDGEITSTVDGSEIPAKDDQSNFGTGFEYQYGADDTIEIFMNEKWIVFEQREEAGNQVRFGDRMVDADGLSEETLEWLDWYNHLSAEEQLAVSTVPPDLLEENGPVESLPEEGCYSSDCDEILKIKKEDGGTYHIEYSVTHLLYVENALGTYNSETGILEFSGKDDMGNDIKAEIENKGDHLEVTVTQSSYEDIIGMKQEFFQEDDHQ